MRALAFVLLLPSLLLAAPAEEPTTATEYPSLQSQVAGRWNLEPANGAATVPVANFKKSGDLVLSFAQLNANIEIVLKYRFLADDVIEIATESRDEVRRWKVEILGDNLTISNLDGSEVNRFVRSR